ncbi:MAG: hypothetical protein MH472_03890 [Bacteroidia bacterium]|nr:hypothetical protein [Bacteroidia bacterium]
MNIEQQLPKHLIGFGGAGSNIVIALEAFGVAERYNCLSYPNRENLPPAINFTTFQAPGTSRVTKTGRVFFTPDMKGPLQVPPSLYQLFEPKAHHILIAGIGGYTGTHLMEHFAKHLTKQNQTFTAICILPFSFERTGTKTLINRIFNKFKNHPSFHFIELDSYANADDKRTLPELFNEVNMDIVRLIG